jgi:hypothetical protein
MHQDKTQERQQWDREETACGPKNCSLCQESAPILTNSIDLVFFTRSQNFNLRLLFVWRSRRLKLIVCIRPQSEWRDAPVV